MKKKSIFGTISVVIFVFATAFTAWAGTAGFEMTFTDLTTQLVGTATLVPTSISGIAKVDGWAGSPMEEYHSPVFSGGYNLSSSYLGGPWLAEMSTYGVYNPTTNSATTFARIVGNCPNASPDNAYYWGSERGFVVQAAWNRYDQTFAITQTGSYQVHISADYSYTVTLDNSNPNFFAELDWNPVFYLGINSTNYYYLDIFDDKSPGTYSGHLDLDIGPLLNLSAGSNLGLQVITEVTTLNWGQESPPFVPLPPTVWLFGSGLLSLAVWRKVRKS